MTRLIYKVDQLEGAAERLSNVSGQRLARAASDAVNSVVIRFDEQMRAGETEDINLTPAYVKSKTDLALSRPGTNPEATITTRGDLTIMGRFQPLVQLRQSSTRKADLGPRRGRPAGVSVPIRKTRPTEQAKWFTMRLRRGLQAGTDVGVFVRPDGGGKPKHLYGPSPYSLARYQIALRQDDLEGDLERTALAEIGNAIDEELTR